MRREASPVVGVLLPASMPGPRMDYVLHALCVAADHSLVQVGMPGPNFWFLRHTVSLLGSTVLLNTIGNILNSQLARNELWQ